MRPNFIAIIKSYQLADEENNHYTERGLFLSKHFLFLKAILYPSLFPLVLKSLSWILHYLDPLFRTDTLLKLTSGRDAPCLRPHCFPQQPSPNAWSRWAYGYQIPPLNLEQLGREITDSEFPEDLAEALLGLLCSSVSSLT